MNRTLLRFVGALLMIAQQSNAAESDVAIGVSEQVTHRMQSGAGASWHALLYPTLSHGGSAFGGSPPITAKHAKLWDTMERHADWLRLKFIRAEMDWRSFQPQRGQFTWDAAEMQILDRILRWAQRNEADVMLQCMWVNADWLAFPEYRGDPALEQVSAPGDLDEFAAGWVALLRELRVKRGYTCIRWINLVNEPNYYWWLVPPDTPQRQDRDRQTQYLAEAMQKVRSALAKANLPVKLMGPDFTDLPVLENLADEPWFEHVDDVDFHSYCSCFDWEDPKTLPASWAYHMGDRLQQTLVKYRDQTAAAGKGLFLTEAGTQTYGFKADDPAPGSFKASLKDTQLLIRAMNLGIDGFNHWSFTNRGDQDGQWQLVDTWMRGWKVWLEEAVPHRDAYYVLGLAIRHLPMRAHVLAAQVTGGQIRGINRVWVSGVRSPKDNSLTLLIVNDAQQSWSADLAVEGLEKNLSLLCSRPDADPAETLTYQSVEVRDGVAELELAPFSLTIVTDTPLPSDGAGRY